MYWTGILHILETMAVLLSCTLLVVRTVQVFRTEQELDNWDFDLEKTIASLPVKDRLEVDGSVPGAAPRELEEQCQSCS